MSDIRDEERDLAELDMDSATPARDEQLEVFDAVRQQSAFPVTPVRLDAQDSFFFRCHKGLACWNACCHGADITLTPYDILRLSRRLGLRPAEFLAQHTLPDHFPKTDLPVAKLKMGGADGKGACPFLADGGCTVYDDRPATCRFYPLGLVSMKMKDGGAKEDFHFLVKEPHCLGHGEAQSQTVAEFRHQQGVDEYADRIRGWIDILMKMASWASIGGPGGKKPTPQTQKMFFMATTDVDAFRSFVFGSSFLDKYAVPPEVAEECRTSDEALLELGYAWLKAVLFNEPTLSLREDVLKDAIARARRELAAGG